MCEGETYSALQKEMVAADTVAERGGTCPLMSDSHVSVGGGWEKWDRERKLRENSIENSILSLQNSFKADW